jgi:hypothetical protein
MKFEQREDQGTRWSSVAVLSFLVVNLGPGILRAELRFDRPTIEVGEVRTGQPLAQRFAFVNEGPEAVEITDVRTSCGCLKSRFEQRAYQPGQSGTVVVEVHTLSQAPGPHTWTARVQYRQGSAHAEALLQVRARVVAEISVQPAALTIVADSAVNHDICISDTRRDSLAVRAVHSSSPRLTARLTNAGQNEPHQKSWSVRISVSDDFPPGRHEEAVVIYTDDPGYRELRVPITIMKRQPQRLAALPNQVTWTAAPDSPLPAQLVRVRDRDNQAVLIDRIVADNPAITCRWAPGPETMATVKILVDSRLLSGGAMRSAIHVHVGKPVREVLTIPVEAVTAAE